MTSKASRLVNTGVLVCLVATDKNKQKVTLSGRVKRQKLNRKVSNPFRKSARGQTLVEFAFVSVFLMLLLFGIIEMGRLLFAFSVVSNAAQEGTRYAITRPRDYINRSAAATRIAMGTPIPTQL